MAERIADPRTSLHGPHLLDLEVAQALRRAVRTGSLEAERAWVTLRLLADLFLTRYPHDPLLPRVWALRDNLSAYDAVYVALAEALGGTLLTCDRRLATAPGITARVDLIE